MQVKVMKIEGIRDYEGNQGRRIELAQEVDLRLPRNIKAMGGLNAERSSAKTEGTRVTLSSLGMPCLNQQIMLPKIILFLTEDEYDKLGVPFDVNQLYNVTLEGHAIKFEKAETETEPAERAMGDKERHS